MAGGTHAFDMIKLIRENENLRKNNYFKTKNTYHRTATSINIDYKTATREEKEILRNKIVEEQAKETQKQIILLMISIVLTGGLILLAVKFALP